MVMVSYEEVKARYKIYLSHKNNSYVLLSDSDLWSQHGGAVTGNVLLAALVEVALSVLVHAGLTGAAGAVAALRGRPPPDPSLRAGARGHARHRALVLVRRRLVLVEGGVFLYSLDAVDCRDTEGVI